MPWLMKAEPDSRIVKGKDVKVSNKTQDRWTISAHHSLSCAGVYISLFSSRWMTSNVLGMPHFTSRIDIDKKPMINSAGYHLGMVR